MKVRQDYFVLDSSTLFSPWWGSFLCFPEHMITFLVMLSFPLSVPMEFPLKFLMFCFSASHPIFCLTFNPFPTSFPFLVLLRGQLASQSSGFPSRPTLRTFSRNSITVLLADP